MSTGSGEVTLKRIAADDAATHDAILELQRRAFLPNEAVCSATGVSKSPEGEQQLLNLIAAALKDGVTVAAYLDGKPVGAAINKMQVRPAAGEESFFERFAREEATDPAARWVLDFMQRVDSMDDLFAAAGGEPLVEIMFLAVLAEAGRRGIGEKLARESVEVARQCGAKGVCAIWTSAYSAAIGRRLGFQELAIAEHSEFTWQEEPIAPKLPPHQQRSVLALLKL